MASEEGEQVPRPIPVEHVIACPRCELKIGLAKNSKGEPQIVAFQLDAPCSDTEPRRTRVGMFWPLTLLVKKLHSE